MVWTSTMTALVLWASSVCAAEKKALPEDVAATVNGQPIAEKIVQSFIANNCAALGIDPQTEDGKSKIPKVRAAVLDELIERALIAQEVKKRGITPSEAEIDAAEKSTIAVWGDDSRYAEFLRMNGFTREEYRTEVLRSAAAGKALTASLVAELKVSQEEVKEYFEKHRSEPEMQWPARVNAAHILFNTMPGVLATQLKASRNLPEGAELDRAVAEETERKRKLADEVRAEAMKPGADFAALAKKYSDDIGTRDAGGSLGIFPEGTHALELDRAAFATESGQVGTIAKTESGFHVIKVFEHKAAGPKTLEEATPTIRAQLLRTKQAHRLQEWLAAARAKAVIVMNG